MRANRSSQHAVAPKARRRSGFTLVEIMVVVIIIGILATFVIAKVIGQSDKARVDTTRAMLAQISTQLDLFKLDHGRYPESLEELITMPNWVQREKWPPGGYIREYPVDAWKNKLVYRRGTSPERPFDLLSYGADAREGGEGYDADLVFGESQK